MRVTLTARVDVKSLAEIANAMRRSSIDVISRSNVISFAVDEVARLCLENGLTSKVESDEEAERILRSYGLFLRGRNQKEFQLGLQKDSFRITQNEMYESELVSEALKRLKAKENSYEQ